MMEQIYFVLGIVLAVIAACCLTVFLICIKLWLQSRNPSFRYRYKKIRYPEGFLKEMQLAYEACGDLKMMLQILSRKYPKGHLNFAIQNVRNYLETSRHKDYETALLYLSDGSKEYQELCNYLIHKELKKRNRLPMKV